MACMAAASEQTALRPARFKARRVGRQATDDPRRMQPLPFGSAGLRAALPRGYSTPGASTAGPAMDSKLMPSCRMR